MKKTTLLLALLLLCSFAYADIWPGSANKTTTNEACWNNGTNYNMSITTSYGADVWASASNTSTSARLLGRWKFYSDDANWAINGSITNVNPSSGGFYIQWPDGSEAWYNSSGDATEAYNYTQYNISGKCYTEAIFNISNSSYDRCFKVVAYWMGEAFVRDIEELSCSDDRRYAYASSAWMYTYNDGVAVNSYSLRDGGLGRNNVILINNSYFLNTYFDESYSHANNKTNNIVPSWLDGTGLGKRERMRYELLSNGSYNAIKERFIFAFSPSYIDVIPKTPHNYTTPSTWSENDFTCVTAAWTVWNINSTNTRYFDGGDYLYSPVQHARELYGLGVRNCTFTPGTTEIFDNQMTEAVPFKTGQYDISNFCTVMHSLGFDCSAYLSLQDSHVDGSNNKYNGSPYVMYDQDNTTANPAFGNSSAMRYEYRTEAASNMYPNFTAVGMSWMSLDTLVSPIYSYVDMNSSGDTNSTMSGNYYHQELTLKNITEQLGYPYCEECNDAFYVAGLVWAGESGYSTSGYGYKEAPKFFDDTLYHYNPVMRGVEPYYRRWDDNTNAASAYKFNVFMGRSAYSLQAGFYPFLDNVMDWKANVSPAWYLADYYAHVAQLPETIGYPTLNVTYRANTSAWYMLDDYIIGNYSPKQQTASNVSRSSGWNSTANFNDTTFNAVINIDGVSHTFNMSQDSYLGSSSDTYVYVGKQNGTHQIVSESPERAVVAFYTNTSNWAPLFNETHYYWYNLTYNESAVNNESNWTLNYVGVLSLTNQTVVLDALPEYPWLITLANVTSIDNYFLVGFSPPSTTLESDLRSYFKMDSDGTFPDEVNGYNGTIQGQVNSTNEGCVEGYCHYFNGSVSADAYVTMHNESYTPTDDQNFTFNIWVYLDAYTTFRYIYGENPGASPGWFALHVYGSNGSVSATFGDTEVYTTTNNISLDTWYMITVTYNGSVGIVYLDGEQDGNVSVTGHTDLNWNWELGRRGWDDQWTWSGYLDELGIWDRALTLEEIQHLYNYGDGCTYPFGCSNFTLSANDTYDGATILNFSAYVGTNYFDTVNGTLETNISHFSTKLWNITIFNVSGYHNRTYLNYNVSSNLLADLWEGILNVNVSEKWTDTQMTNFTVEFANSTVSTTNGTMTFYLSGGSHNATVYVDEYYPLTAEVSVGLNETNTTIIEGLYNVLVKVNATNLDNNASILSFNATLANGSLGANETYSTTNGSVFFGAIKDSFNVSIVASGFVENSQLVNMSTNATNVSFQLYAAQVVNITFLDEDLQTAITWDNLTAQFIIDGVEATEYNITNGSGALYLENMTIGDYEVRYTGTMYLPRVHYFTVTSTSSNTITLYLLNASVGSNVTNTVYDEYADYVPNFYIRLYRYYLSSNSYVQVDMVRTSFNGQGVLRAKLDTEYYKFQITATNGTQYSFSDSTRIQSTSLTHYIVLGQPFGQLVSNLLGVQYGRVTYDNATGLFRFEFNNPGGTIVGASLNLYEYKAGSPVQMTLVNTTSLNATSGIIYVGIPDLDTPATYWAYAYLQFSEDYDPTFVDSSSYTLTQSPEILGIFGLLFSAFLVLLFGGGLFLASGPTAGVIGAGAGLFFSRLAGLNGIEWTWIAGIMGLCLVIAFVIGRRG